MERKANSKHLTMKEFQRIKEGDSLHLIQEEKNNEVEAVITVYSKGAGGAGGSS
jgi:hypothetical protein